MKIKRNPLEEIFNIFNVLFMIILSVFTIYPIFHVAIASFSDANLFMAHEGLVLKPYGFDLVSYKAVFKNPMITSGYMNTIFIVVVGVSINLFLTSLGAYVLSRRNVFWKNPIMALIVFTMFFSGGLIPNYLNIRDLHLYNTLWAIILPSAINTFNLIIMRTSFQGIPDSLEESAKLDGAGHFTILFRIILPLSSAVIAVMVLYYGVGHWNSWFSAMMFLQNRDLYPLQLVLREVLIANNTENMSIGTSALDQEAIKMTIKYAVIMVATIPILALYPFLQKYFVKGVMVGALKG